MRYDVRAWMRGTAPALAGGGLNSLWRNPRGVRPAIHPGQTAVMNHSASLRSAAFHPGQTACRNTPRYSSVRRLVSRPNSLWHRSALWAGFHPQAVNSLWQNPRGVRPAIHPGQTACGNRTRLRPAIHPGQTACGKTHAAFGRRSIPADSVPARRSSLRFSRNTPGIPPSRALSAGRGLGAHPGSTTGCYGCCQAASTSSCWAFSPVIFRRQRRDSAPAVDPISVRSVISCRHPVILGA